MKTEGKSIEFFFQHFKSLDWLLILAVFLLFLIGSAAIWSASLKTGDFSNLYKQIIFFASGFVLMLALSFIDWRVLRENPYFVLALYLLGVLSLLGLLFFGPTIRNIRAWYKIGPVSIDPLEPFKIILIILLARYFSRRHAEMYNIFHIVISGLYVLIPSALVFLQPDFGGTILLVFLWVAVLSICGIKFNHLLILFFCALLVFSLSWFYFLKDYQRQRIISFINPEIEPLGMSWSQTQAKIAIGSGGLLGKGLGKGTQTQYGFLTESQTDFIFALIAEETGFLGAAAVIFLIGIVFWRLIRIVFKAADNFPRIFVSSFAFLFLFQDFIHIGMNLGMLPTIGVPLIFVSYGGGGLISSFIALGLCQSIKHETQNT